ncbi:MAG: tetratricopeptide repeat protein [Bacteroidetes bacterium]|nr:tetratricopeptide repeat protein [Bacteroidota bacterium]
MTSKEAAAPVDMELFVKNAVASLNTSGQKEIFDQLVKQAEKDPEHGLDSLVKFWDKNRRPDMAAYFTEKTALNLKTASAWIKAGDRYYYSIQFVKDISEVAALYGKAIRCYSEGLKLEPGNVDAKIQLASCYVDQSVDPMKGISMLREVEKTDSNNVKLQMTFALFSVKSGQFDKAIRRFENVVRIDPSFIEAYLHMADAYDQMGNKAKTIEMLEKFESLTPDMFAKKEVRKSIEGLKKK